MGYAPIGAFSQGFESLFGSLDPDRIIVKSWIWIRIFLQMTRKNVWDMRIFEHFFKVMSLYSEAWIRIRIKVNGRIRNHRTRLETKD
jgi:hypothetical protein